MPDYSNISFEELQQGTRQYARTMVATLRDALLALAENPEAEITFKNRTIRNNAEDRKFIQEQLAKWEHKAGLTKYRPVRVVYRDGY